MGVYGRRRTHRTRYSARFQIINLSLLESDLLSKDVQGQKCLLEYDRPRSSMQGSEDRSEDSLTDARDMTGSEEHLDDSTINARDVAQPLEVLRDSSSTSRSEPHGVHDVLRHSITEGVGFQHNGSTRPAPCTLDTASG